jgi:hypothetical protein
MKEIVRDQIHVPAYVGLREADHVLEPRDQKRKVIDVSHEIELLEKNKKRLLDQPDWIGMDPSKPVSLRFLSSKEKDRIGKRRRITGTHRTAIRQRLLAKSAAQPAYDTFERVFENGAVRQIDNVRIRIGTDALTNTHSNKPNEDEHPQASPESMLFCQEEPYAQHDAEEPNLAPPINPQLHALTNAAEKASAVHHEHRPTSENIRRFSTARPQEPSSSPDDSEQGSSVYHAQLELQPPYAITTHEERIYSPPAFQLMHGVQGNERALRFVFGDSKSSASGPGHILSENHDIGDTQPAHEPHRMQVSKAEPMHQLNIDREQSAVDESSGALPIVDEEPWRTYLAISDGGSSHSNAAIRSRNGMLHDRPAPQYSNEVVTNRSQHVRQGDQSCISSPAVSTSLPSVKRSMRTSMSKNLSGVDSTRRWGLDKEDPHTLTEDQRLWQAFVFGSDVSSSSQSMHNHACDSLQMETKESENASSRCLAYSAATSSVSSTPFETRTSLAFCMRGNLQNGAPPLESPAPAFRESVALSNYERSDSMTERNAFDGRSMTYASLQNNASSDSVSSRIFSDTKTSRKDLDRADPVRDASFNPGSRTTNARKLERTTAEPCSVQDLPVSDDMLLDLVDPDRM